MNKAEYLREYYLKNKEKMNADTAVRRKDNKEKYLSYQYKYRNKRNATDPHFRLLNSMRKRVCKILKNKSEDTVSIIGCSKNDLKKHLEAQFTAGMTWENYGQNGWHVDHIIPVSSAKTKEELLKLCHYSNLQPLWAKDNLRKSNKMPLTKQS